MKKKLLFLAFIAWFSISAQAQILINEYSASNLSTIEDDNMKYEDWIELYNTTDSTINLQGYYLSDDVDNPKLWQIPVKSGSIKAKGTYVVWCSGRDTARFTGGAQRSLHANFKLTQTKKNAETLVLSDPSGKKIDEIKIAKTRVDQSRGRLTNGSATWVIFNAPTPKKNNEGNYFTANAEKPSFSVKPGFYTANQVVTITTKEPNATIYYSLNGQDPTPKSTKYTAPITISKTAVLKAVSYSDDDKIQPSLIEFSSYFINNKHTLKVVSVTGGFDLDSLANGNKTFSPFGSFEIFDEAGERKATTYGSFNSHGQDSWINDQRSIDFISRDECGYNSAIKDKLFKNSERTDFQRIILRAAGDDNYPGGSGIVGGGAHLRDSYLQNLVKRGKMHLDVREGEKAIIYINGNYWGVYDLRERPDDHDYTDFNYGQGKYDLQFIQTWSDTWAEYGGDKALTDWKKFATYVETNDMKDPAKYKIVTDQLDVKSLTDYVITNSVSVCSDWLNYNTGWWRGKNPKGTHQKWGYHLWDNDATFGYYINYTGIPDTAANKAKPCDVELLSDSITITFDAYIAEDTIEFGGQIFLPGDTISPAFTFRDLVDLNKHMLILKKLRENPEFNQYYITRYTDLMLTVFSQKNMLSYLDEEYNRIKPEMAEHIKRWGGTMKQWEQNVSKLRHYILRRTNYLNEGVRDCYKVTGPYETTFDITNAPNGATMEINSQTITKFPYTAKYFGNIDTKIKASTTAKEYTFAQWSAKDEAVVAKTNEASTLVKISGNATVTAIFGKAIIAVSDASTTIVEAKIKAFPTIFNTQLNLEYELPEAAEVKVRLIDLNGKTLIIANDFNAYHEKGVYNMSFDVQNAALNAGFYLLDFQAGDFHKVVKVIKD